MRKITNGLRLDHNPTTLPRLITAEKVKTFTPLGASPVPRTPQRNSRGLNLAHASWAAPQVDQRLTLVGQRGWVGAALQGLHHLALPLAEGATASYDPSLPAREDVSQAQSHEYQKLDGMRLPTNCNQSLSQTMALCKLDTWSQFSLTHLHVLLALFVFFFLVLGLVPCDLETILPSVHCRASTFELSAQHVLPRRSMSIRRAHAYHSSSFAGECLVHRGLPSQHTPEIHNKRQRLVCSAPTAQDSLTEFRVCLIERILQPIICPSQ